MTIVLVRMRAAVRFVPGPTSALVALALQELTVKWQVSRY